MMASCGAPILSLEDLAATLSERHRHQTIVLANGAFDLLHVGHLRYLEAAKQAGDVLVVAINADLGVRRAKGPTRPVIPDGERAELVAALRCVDYVTVFEHETVHPIIEAIRPHVHAKGTDYTEHSVPEGALVRAYGGRVAIVGDAKDHATSMLVKKLAANSANPSP